ncbi:hypothetical protein [Secundilactobacillus kimchicus]|uniref:hypothetical protein n=1 Tax=Secundilactobacillus kimchicus TaxID=528209 RepID=UPI0024A7AE50|nr:hypothetical protein [Secundilactobacillus kimchicus]
MEKWLSKVVSGTIIVLQIIVGLLVIRGIYDLVTIETLQWFEYFKLFCLGTLFSFLAFGLFEGAQEYFRNHQ